MNFEQEKTQVLLLSILILILLIAFTFLSDTHWARLVSLFQILVWPTIVLFGGLFFKKVFTYLFFSLDEFNFFGAKGTLKEVQEVIAEKAKILKDEEKDLENISKLEKQAKENKDSAEILNKILRDLFEKYKILQNDYQKIKIETDRRKIIQEALEERAKVLSVNKSD